MYLKGIQNGKYPGKYNQAFVNGYYSDYPGTAENRQQNNSSFDEIPIICTYTYTVWTCV